MELIIFSPPTFIATELKVLNLLFNRGLACYHLRKPNSSCQQIEQFIQGVSPQYHQRIVLHQHHTLLTKFPNLKGIHLKEYERRTKKPIDVFVHTYQKKGYTVSTSVHDMPTLLQLGNINYQTHFNYVFVSPVFSSISKSNYHPKVVWHPANWHNKIPFNVVALGGVEPLNIPVLVSRGFTHAAVLGAIWKHKNVEDMLKTFGLLQKACMFTSLL